MSLLELAADLLESILACRLGFLVYCWCVGATLLIPASYLALPNQSL